MGKECRNEGMSECKVKEMKKTGIFIFSCYYWFAIFFFALLMFPLAFLVWILTVSFDRRLRLLHQFTCLWSDATFRMNPLWRVQITGIDKVDRSGTYIIVSNHQSGADVMVLFKMYIHFKWVAKRSLFQVPLIGWSMSLNRYLALERSSSGSMRKMIRDASRYLAGRNSLMIFPEGSRSRDGAIKPFKTGAFHIALETGTPILPVAIHGTSRAIDPRGFLILPNKDIRLEVLDPIPIRGYHDLDPKSLAELVHDRIADAL